MPLEYHMQVGDTVSVDDIERFINSSQGQWNVSYPLNDGSYTNYDSSIGVISVGNVPGYFENGVAIREGTIKLPLSISAHTECSTYLSVTIGEALDPLEQQLYGYWYRYNQPQDWFFSWLQDAVGGTFLQMNNYREAEKVDFTLYEQPGLQKPHGNYVNTSGQSKYIPEVVFWLYGSSVTVDLSEENLQGALPEQLEFNQNYDVEYIFSDNQLTGSLPAAWGDMHTYGTVYIDVSNNKLSGTIPYAMGYMQAQSVILNLAENQFYGFDADFNTNSVIDFTSSDFSCNFFPDSDLEKFNIVGQPQYYVTLATNDYVTVAMTDLVDETFLKQQLQIVCVGTPQDIDTVASELTIGVIPGEDFDTVFHDNGDRTYYPYSHIRNGSALGWIGFVRDKQGNTITPNNTIGASTTFIVFEQTANAVVKAVKQNDIVQVVVSGRSLQNVLTKTFAIGYNKNDLELIDAYAPTLQQDLSVGLVPGSNMNITELIPGSLKFQLAPNMGTYTYWGGVATILKFRAKRNITTVITLE